MRAIFALGAILGITVRQIRQARRTLGALIATDQSCDISWCACDCGDDRAPCSSSLSLLQRNCTLPAGHDGLHQHGGTSWTSSFGAAA